MELSLKRTGALCRARLNPCFNGIQMEHLLLCQSDYQYLAVLILVLMEYKWNVNQVHFLSTPPWSLNPCFNGIQMELSVKPNYNHITDVS